MEAHERHVGLVTLAALGDDIIVYYYRLTIVVYYHPPCPYRQVYRTDYSVLDFAYYNTGISYTTHYVC